MDLPVKFPSETEVILEDVARFRTMSPAEQLRSLRILRYTAALIGRKSLHAAWAKQYLEEQENLAHRNTREFLDRHATGP